MISIPKIFFSVKAESEGYTQLNVFDNCLLEAGIGDTNLVKMSSIIPPGCSRVEQVKIPPGSLIPIAYAFRYSDIPGEVISAAVAVAIPEDENEAGLIMEYSAATNFHEAEEVVKVMAEKGFEKRNRKIKQIYVDGTEHRVKTRGGVFAGVVLWY